MDGISNYRCQTCGTENSSEAILCKSCVVRLDSALIPPPLPVQPLTPGASIAERLIIESQIWLPPSYSPQQFYNAYTGSVKDDPTSHYILVEQLNETEETTSPVSDGLTEESCPCGL